jgi:ABC-type branched-subunit amino acid transport system substrate-binding protein
VERLSGFSDNRTNKEGQELLEISSVCDNYLMPSFSQSYNLIACFIILHISIFQVQAEESANHRQIVQPKIKFGIILPLSGEFARFGINARKAIELATKKVVGPFLPEIIFEDNPSCGPTDAITPFRKLVSVDKIEVVATFCTGAAKSVAPLAQAIGLPHIHITETPDTNDVIMIKMMPSSRPWIDYIVTEYAKRWKRIALIANDMELNTGKEGNINLVTQGLAQRGSQVVLKESFQDTQLDFRTLITKLKATDAQAISPFIYPAQQMAAFLRQADEMHLWDNKELAGNYVFEVMSQELFKLYPAIQKRDGLLSVNFVDTTSSKYRQEYQTEYNEPVPPFTDIAYDTYALVALCGKDVSCMLQPHLGASGELRFDNRRGRIGKHELRVLHNGKFETAIR